jgi:hypothetical protein
VYRSILRPAQKALKFCFRVLKQTTGIGGEALLGDALWRNAFLDLVVKLS